MISDVHSNMEALEKVLEKIRELSVDRVLALGDIVGYGPNPVEIVESFREHVDVCIMGNHDEAVLKEPRYFNRIPYEAVMWTKIQFSVDGEEHLRYLSTLPEVYREEGMLLTHGLLDNNMCYVDSTDDLVIIFDGMDKDDFICFGGHSHFPSLWILRDGEIQNQEMVEGEEVQIPEDTQKVWVNVGSVGQPRDGDRRVSFVTWDTETRRLGYHRLEYDYRKTMGKIRGVPELDNYLAERLEKGI